jgi:hypothetical protein
MSVKKTAKSTDGQQDNSGNTCHKCNTEKKPIKIMGLGKPRFAFECKCGLMDRMGNKIA